MNDPWLLAVYPPAAVMAAIAPFALWRIWLALRERGTPAALAVKSGFLLSLGVLLSVALFGATRLPSQLWPDYLTVSTSPPALFALYIVGWCGALSCTIAASFGMERDWTLNDAWKVALGLWLWCVAGYFGSGFLLSFII